jgi:hypothetical protein
MVNNGYPYKDKKLIKLVAIVLVCVAICFTAGIITILYLQQHTSRPNTGSDTNASSDTNSRPWSTKDEFYQKMRGIKIGTARDIVERSIGKPDLCSRKIYRGEYELQHCGYDLGDPETYQEIVYMNGEVWGISSVVGSINQLNSF